MNLAWIAGGVAAATGAGVLCRAVLRKNVHNWLPAYFSWQHEAFEQSQPVHIYFCFVDHYEPLWKTQDEQLGLERVQRWISEYPRLADQFRDSEGRVPQHSFFFPAEEYRPRYMDLLKDLCARGYGDMEIHLHHDRDSEQNFIDTVEQFIATLQSHGFLQDRSARERFGFIHGNWCLDNSRRDGRWCGLNNELELLTRLGCYADFTYPSAPSETQPRMVNAIYYARDDARKPKSHNIGRPACVGVSPAHDELCLITGPLGLDFGSRKYGVIPRIENADVNGGIVADARRVRNWVRFGARVLGAPNHVFIKVHTHGTQEKVYDAVLGEQARGMYSALCALKGEGYRLHFVTAYEMWKTVRRLEQAGVSCGRQSARIQAAKPTLVAEPQR